MFSWVAVDSFRSLLMYPIRPIPAVLMVCYLTRLKPRLFNTQVENQEPTQSQAVSPVSEVMRSHLASA